MAIDKEIRKYINRRFNKIIEDKLSGVYIRMSNLEFSLNNFKFNLMSTDDQIKQHALGVQNVYDQVKEIQEFFKIAQIDEYKMEKLSKIREILD